MSLEIMIAYHIHWGCVYGNNGYHRSHYQRQYHNTIPLLKMRRLIKSLLGFLYISWPFNSQPKPSNKIGKTKWKNSMSWEFSPLQKEQALIISFIAGVLPGCRQEHRHAPWNLITNLWSKVSPLSTFNRWHQSSLCTQPTGMFNILGLKFKHEFPTSKCWLGGGSFLITINRSKISRWSYTPIR